LQTQSIDAAFSYYEYLKKEGTEVGDLSVSTFFRLISG
jgi:hypothetical protein